MIQMVVFDMAGTTVDEKNIVYKTLHRTLQAAGFRLAFEDVVTAAAGKEKKQAITELMNGKATENLVHDTYTRFQARLREAYQTMDVLPQYGAGETFRYLRKQGIKVVLNTSHDQAAAEHLLWRLNWTRGIHYDLLVTASQVCKSRPHPDMIHLAQQKLGIPATSHVVKVGDSTLDIEEGRNAGCGLLIGITTGAHTHEQLATARPNHIIDHLLGLKEWI